MEDGRVYFEDPNGGRFFHIDQTTSPQPDALADWQRQERSVRQRRGYELISLQRVDYRDYDAADWEFRWSPLGDSVLHVRSRNMITDPGDRAYALYFSTPEDQWEDSQGIFAVLVSTFQPAS